VESGDFVLASMLVGYYICEVEREVVARVVAFLLGSTLDFVNSLKMWKRQQILVFGNHPLN
jgi:hypothetical protein